MSLDIKDAVGLTKALKTTLAAGEHTPHHIVDGTVAVSGPLTDSQLRASAVPVALDNNSLTALENISVTFPSTQNVSVQNASLAITAASLPLPLGAATSANQSTLIGHVDGIEGLLTTIDADTGSIDTKLPSLTAGGRIPVDIGGNGSITVTSGTITVQNEVEVKNDSGNPVPVSDNGSSLTVDGTVSSNLQDGSGNALTSSSRGSQRALSVQIVDGSGNQITSFGSATVASNTRDGSGNAITSTVFGSTRRLDVNLSSAGTVGSAAPTSANLYAGSDGTNLRAISVDSSGRINTNINGTVPVSGTFWQATQPVSGTVNSNVSDGSGNAITSTVSGSSRRLDVMLSSGGTTGSAVPTNANLVGGTDGTNLRGLSVDSSGRVNTNLNNTLYTDATFTVNQTGAISSGAVLVASTDISGYREASIHYIAGGTGSTGITPQVSNDGTNWVSVNTSGVNTTITTTSNSFYTFSLRSAKFFRVIHSGTQTSGTTNFVCYLSQFGTPTQVGSLVVTNSSTVSVAPSPATGNGHSTQHTAISTASTNATNVKASNTNIGSLNLVNTTASLRYFKLFNSATAPTVGTSTPVLNYAIPPNSSMFVDCGFAGIRLSTGLSYAITAGQALLDNTAVGAGDVVVNIAYA